VLAPYLTVLLTFVPDVVGEIGGATGVLLGLFLVTAVVPEVRLAVVQVTDELQLEALPGIAQEVAERVPEGQAAVLQAWLYGPEQSAPPLDGTGLVQVRVWVPVLPQAVTLQGPQALQPPGITGAQELPVQAVPEAQLEVAED